MKPIKVWALLCDNGKIDLDDLQKTRAAVAANAGTLYKGERIVRLEIREVPRGIKPKTVSHERVPVQPRQVLAYRPVVTPEGALPRPARRGLAENGGET